MKPNILAFICTVLVCGSVTVRAQVAPSATRGQFSLTAGAEGSVFQPDYAGNGFAQTSHRLYGIGTYVDMRFARWVQLEVEGRWLHFNEYYPPTCSGACPGIDENTYMIGPRIPIHTFGRFTPYGKALFGWGSGTFLMGRSATMAFGGGADYRLTRRISARADFEYERWSVNPTTLWPYGVSVGLSYRVF